jgi:GTP-binding protein HflX
MEVVGEVLAQLGASNNPMLTVYNKCDIAGEVPNGTDSAAISAITGMGMDGLKDAVTQKLFAMKTDIAVLLPLDAGALVSRIYAAGQVHECDYRENGIYIKATVNTDDASRLRASALETDV